MCKPHHNYSRSEEEFCRKILLITEDGSKTMMDMPGDESRVGSRLMLSICARRSVESYSMSARWTISASYFLDIYLASGTYFENF
jgi:hypothetical protein